MQSRREKLDESGETFRKLRCVPILSPFSAHPYDTWHAAENPE